MNADYDRDLYTWSHGQAALLRERRFDQIDLEHIIREIGDMGRSERRALESRFESLMTHLLKWVHQPSFRGGSWRLTITEQRERLRKHLRDSPGLNTRLAEAMADAYDFARIRAERETGLAVATFPEQCPWSVDQLGNQAFWPEAAA